MFERDSKNKTTLHLISNTENILFSPICIGAKDFTYLATAPQNCYKRSVAFKLDEHGAPEDHFFLYWKIDRKMYGKIRVFAYITDQSLDDDYSESRDGVYKHYVIKILIHYN
jgi:hypothetical protein